VRAHPERTRIAFLGDSITYGTGIPAEAVFTEVLEQRLNALRPGPGFCIVSLAQPGYGFHQNLAVAEVELPRLRSAIVFWEFWSLREYAMIGRTAYEVSTFELRDGTPFVAALRWISTGLHSPDDFNAYAPPRTTEGASDNDGIVSGPHGFGVLPDSQLPLVCVGCGAAGGVSSTAYRLVLLKLWQLLSTVSACALLAIYWARADQQQWWMHIYTLRISLTMTINAAVLLGLGSRRWSLPLCSNCGRRRRFASALIHAGYLLLGLVGPMVVNFILNYWSGMLSPYNVVFQNPIGRLAVNNPMEAGLIVPLVVSSIVGGLGDLLAKPRADHWDGQRLWFSKLPETTHAAWLAALK
jgi:hypothetical protein